MPPLVAPRPRPSRPKIYHDLFFDTPRASTSTAPPRLLSPIQLAPSALISQSNCIFTSKRRVKPHASRRRPASPLGPPPASPTPAPQRTHPFDHLPWVPVLDAEPMHSQNLSDIADLSQLAPISRPSGPGPVRRRKTSLRSSPLTPLAFHPTAPSSARTTISRTTLPPRDTRTPPISDPYPSTPPQSRFDPSRVIFRHLMPVLSDSSSHDSNASDPCTFTPAFQLC